MKLLESWIQIEPNNKRMDQPVNVWAVNMSMDSFGKYSTSHTIFDTYSRKELVFKDKDKLEEQAKNCLDKFVGWKI